MTTAATRPATDSMVDGAVPIAVRDYGGDGPDVLLLPGAGRTLVDWGPVAARLDGYRLVAMDLRNHGLSGDGEWTMANTLVDVQTVIDGLALNRPALVGHSLGGMIAGLWGDAHAECPAAINLDGHGQGSPEHYDGLDPDLVRQRMAEMRELSTQAAAVPALPAEQAEALIAAHIEQTRQAGFDTGTVEEGIRRSLRTVDGMVQLRPVAPFTQQLVAELESLDLITVWAATQCPLLVINAVAPMQTAPLGPNTPEWLGEMMAAYRTGLTRTIGALAEKNPLVTLEEFDGDHGLLLNKPDATADLIQRFLDKHLR